MDDKTKNIIALVLSVVIAAWMLKASYGKLIAHPEVVDMFTDKLGFGTTFMYIVGALEVAGAIGLFIPKLRKLAALGLIGLMIGAQYSHFKMGDPFTHYIGASIVIALCGALLYFRK